MDTFGNDFGHFWNFENFLIFKKIFEDSTLHGTLGKKIFQKICPKTRSKHVWILVGTILGIFGILKKKLKIFKNSTLDGTPGIKFFRKNHPKTRLGTFGNTFAHFWNFENIFFRKFSKTGHSMENWAKSSRKVCTKTCSKHVWILLGTILGVFGILIFF